MSIEIITTISPEIVEQIRTHLTTLMHHLTPDVSNYAKGRQRFWLEHEWRLRERDFVPAVHDERLWDYLKRIWPEAELGLAAYGHIGIKPHRDDSYADYPAVTINLGEVEGWMYNQQYQGLEWGPQGPPNPITYKIKSGDVILFNCKNQHAPINPAEDRWSINLWHVSSKQRAQFNTYLEGLK
jgi:hypothetical protein